MLGAAVRRVAQLRRGSAPTPTAGPEQPLIEPIIPEYQLDVRSRYGYHRPPIPELVELFDKHREEYTERLRSFRVHLPMLARIPPHPTGSGEPFWVNDYFTGLDAVALYAMLAERNPRILLEVGSGSSTRFARRAIRDHQLRTIIISIDPDPRWDILGVSDEIIRMPFQDVEPARLPALGQDDVFFFDGTHYVFSNTDTTAALMEVLPGAHPGTLLHFHDIYLPWDYPVDWRERHYGEQFVVAAFLMADSMVDVLLPVQYCVRDLELHAILQPLWWALEREGAATNGQSLWLTRR
jgi:methyltransferase family protein